MTQDIFDARIWEEAWRTDPTTFANRTKKAGVDPARSFDYKAKDFNEQVFSEEGVRRRERIIGWLEAQGVDFDGASVLDVGAASGGFSVPFAERGANVTAVEPNVPLGELLAENAKRVEDGSITIVRETFEAIDLEAAGWRNAFDIVFASMCPAVRDWQSVEDLISCASRYCYISLIAGSSEHGLMDPIKQLITNRKVEHHHSEMGYLLQLLYLKGYSYTSLVTREMKTVEMSMEDAIQEVMTLLRQQLLPVDERSLSIVTDYLNRTYPDNKVVFQQGGRFGKVLIQTRDQNMYSKQA
ncbi:methyltransferase domain-containing protein [Paenibacillus sp. P96]|uniref:Methyltransferase domain-containing protein n=1 Tax=Paenibacillus zeirhizosphaerae TaxID=2987519 RepID=A0ABT9FUL9_9BACL|nr:class I SAM-dependent methyltransferase [Paenibacillus sp. P96]MDP4098315.1 methyltransferase domain-containing protein [Paenibacillus sp. P96]